MKNCTNCGSLLLSIDHGKLSSISSESLLVCGKCDSLYSKDDNGSLVDMKTTYAKYLQAELLKSSEF